MRTAILKVAVTAVTVVATVTSAFFVTSHFKNPQAPLQPTVLGDNRSGASAFGGGLSVGPSVEPSNVEPVASTYAS